MNACWQTVEGFLDYVLCLDLSTNYIFVPAMMIMLGIIFIGTFSYFRNINRGLMAGGAIMTMLSTIAVMIDLININWFMMWFVIMIGGVAMTMLERSDVS